MQIGRSSHPPLADLGRQRILDFLSHLQLQPVSENQQSGDTDPDSRALNFQSGFRGLRQAMTLGLRLSGIENLPWKC